jgi:hypothetical protein
MTLLKRLLHEPLVLFLLAGSLLFLVVQWRGDGGGPGSNRIVITPGLIDHLAAGYAATWQRPPSDAELKGLIDDYVREEIATREAVAMGLDRDDTIIRRRLRQKLEFLVGDEAGSTPPTDAELTAWLDRHSEALRTEPRVSFRQVYVRPDRHGTPAAAEAAKLLAKLRAAGPDVAIAQIGDASMLPAEQPLEPVREVERAFGADFARELLTVPPGQWTGPLESPFGLHLVYVRERVAGGKPAMEDVRPLVEREVRSERRAAQIQALYDRWLAKYVITIEQPVAAPAARPKAMEPKAVEPKAVEPKVTQTKAAELTAAEPKAAK